MLIRKNKFERQIKIEFIKTKVLRDNTITRRRRY